MIYRFPRKLGRKEININKDATKEEKNEIKGEAKDEQAKNENNENKEEQNKKIIEMEEFNKLSPEEQKDLLSKRVATKKVRCKNWPNCKDPNCIYAHPTETVRIFLYNIFI